MSSDLSIVIQGPVSSRTTARGFATAEVISRARTLYPDSQIIYSGWKNGILPESVESLLDEAIYSEPVEQNTLLLGGRIIRKENTNRQIVSTVKGLRATNNHHVLKIRSDCLPVRRIDFKKLYERVSSHIGGSKPRILVTKNYTRVFFVHDGVVSYSPLHISDLIHFGSREDLLEFWDGALLQDTEFTCGSKLYTAEQMLCGRFVRNKITKKLPPPFLPFSRKTYSELIDHLRVLNDYFYFVAASEFGIKVPQRFNGKWFERHLFLCTSDIERIIAGGISSYERKAVVHALLYRLKRALGSP